MKLVLPGRIGMDGEFATIVIISLIIGIVLFGINFLENNSIWLF